MSGGTSLRVGASEVARKTQAVTLTDPVTGEQAAIAVDTAALEAGIGAITDNPSANPDADGSIIAKIGGMWNSLVTAVAHLLAIETATEALAADTSDVPTYGVIQYVEVTLSTDTSAYASGDVIADTQIVAAAVRANDAKGVLHSLTIIDQDDQKALLYIYLLSANVAMGTENAAPSISDANALEILGPPVAIAVADYYDLGGVAIAGKDAIGKVVKPATGTDDLYVAVVNGTGTPTYTASGLKLRLGFLS